MIGLAMVLLGLAVGQEQARPEPADETESEAAEEVREVREQVQAIGRKVDLLLARLQEVHAEVEVDIETGAAEPEETGAGETAETAETEAAKPSEDTGPQEG